MLNSGDTAWMITATALVLFMTIPGLSLFYAGLVRAKNVLSVLMQCFALTGLMSILWAIFGYSLASTDGGSLNQWIGGLDKLFLSGVTVDALTGTIPESVFMTFPDDLRHHHPRTYCRCLCRTHEVFGDDLVYGLCGSPWSTCRSGTGSGGAVGSPTWAPLTLPVVP